MVQKCRHRLATNRELVEKELKKPHKLFDDFLENFVFDINDHEELCNLTGKRKEIANVFMDKVLTSVEKGSYDLLLHILKTEMCNAPHVYQRIVQELEKTPDQSVPEKSVSITLKSGKLYTSNEDNTHRTDASEGCTFTITIKGDARGEHQIKENLMKMEKIMVREFGALPTHVTDGSVVIHLKSVDGDIISRLTDSIRTGQFVRLIEELFSYHEANSSIPSDHWSVDFIIELDNSSSKMKLPATPLKFVVKTGDHRLQLLHANKAFLQEEIDPLTLLEAFSKKGFDSFKEVNIEIIPERKLRTDKCLDILEKESDQLMEVFIQILEDQNMNFVLKRLKLYKKMKLIDAALLKKNILKHIESIVDEVDLEDIKDEIISRYGLHKDMLEELYSQYPEGSEGRIVAMIVDILGQGDSAVCMFIDILFNSGIDSSLLEELSDIEQVSVDIDYVGDNVFEIIREIPKRGLIFQCEIEFTVEVKVAGQTCNLIPYIVDRATAVKLMEKTKAILRETSRYSPYVTRGKPILRIRSMDSIYDTRVSGNPILQRISVDSIIDRRDKPILQKLSIDYIDDRREKPQSHQMSEQNSQ